MRVLTFGEALGCFAANEPGKPDTYHRSIGGAEANTAIGLARLGHEVSWFSRVSTDRLGDHIRSILAGEGVRTSQCIRVGDRPTGVMIKHRTSPDTVDVTYYRRDSAASELGPSDLDAALISSADILHVTGVTVALGEEPRKLVAAALKTAVAAGVPVSFDMNYRPKLITADDAVLTYEELLPLVSQWFCNESEAELLTGLSDPIAACAELAARGPGTVIVKCGSRGAVACVDGELTSVEADRVQHPVDPVGAGDAFNAGWLHGWALRLPTTTRLRVAAFVAARVVEHPGDYEGFPSLPTVNELVTHDTTLA